MKFEFPVWRNYWQLWLLAMTVLISGCVQGGLQLPIKDLDKSLNYSMVSEEGDRIELSGLHSISYEDKNKPAVRFQTLSQLPEGKVTDSWSIPWVILDYLERQQHRVKITDVEQQRAVQGSAQPYHFVLELDYVDALTAESRKRLLEWGADFSSLPAKILYLRFDGQEVDLSGGNLLILRYDEQGGVEIEQRSWQGPFEKERLFGRGEAPEFGVGTQSVARSILDELGY